MRPIIPAAANQSRTLLTAIVLGTAFAAGAHSASATTTHPSGASAEVIRDITRYCQACWRNARLPADRWADCTQQVFARLLESIPQERWNTVLADDEGPDRREFVRAIDAVKKRTQRLKKYADLPPDHADRRTADAEQADQREQVARAAAVVLSERQQAIVQLSATGWAVPDIAQELGTTPERVSDEKYKAIRKLRAHLRVDG